MTKEQILDVLKSLGVVRLYVEYSGGGDSGAIDSVTAFLADGTETPFEGLEEKQAGTDGLKTLIITNKLTDGNHKGVFKVFMDYAYDLLEKLDDWCNNDGGRGEMTVYVEETGEHGAGTIHVEHRTFYTESNDTEHFF